VLVDRPDWPERPFLVEWLQAHGRCLMTPHINAVTEELAPGVSGVADVSHSPSECQAERLKLPRWY
jgi:hypothetical protein